MKSASLGAVLIAFALPVAASETSAVSADTEAVQFNRDIRPILSDHCFACHGPDEGQRQAGLRLDVADLSRQPLASGAVAIVPGKSAESELVERISTSDASQRMPPAEINRPLSPRQIELLTRWIDQGAPYQSHWSLVPLAPVAVPPVSGLSALNPIDAFVQARLSQEGLAPSPEAETATLIRRVTLDLTGLPPSVAEVDAFLADASPDAYERVVDRLLQSPRYGERMAQEWLDAARYADTHGFNNDTTRYMWRWRDWVIDAWNRNLPYDQFLTDQLAGDLLPGATLDQRIATGFNRNHVINSEGGIIGEEYRVEYVADRVHTTSTVLMGLSLACARCHDHKFDPISQKEYFQLFAFFNSVPEQGEAGRVGNADPLIKAPTPEQAAQLTAQDAELAHREQSLADRAAELAAAPAAWEAELALAVAQAPAAPADPALHLPLDEQSGAEAADTVDTSRRGQINGPAAWTDGQRGGALRLEGQTHVDLGQSAAYDRQQAFSWGGWVYPVAQEAMAVLSKMDDAQAYRGYDLLLADGHVTVHMIHRWPDNALHVKSKSPYAANRWQHVLVTYDGSSRGAGLALYVDGQPQELEITHDSLTETILSSQPLRVGQRSTSAPFKGMLDDVRIYGRALSPDEVKALAADIAPRELLAQAPEARSPVDQQRLLRYYQEQVDAEYRQRREARDAAASRKAELEKTVPTAMVMQDLPVQRATFVLKRGQYDQPDPEQAVTPGVPASLGPMPAGAPPNRLGLAQWLTSPEHPLTSRVMVNRLWQLYFGLGLVETMEDFGAQGQWPTHPELLDWLAGEYIRSGWDTKALARRIVTSATYRQTSRVSPALVERDPQNRLLARGPRFRLSAEGIRDNALAISGLMRDHLGGPSVSPYQPAGLWDDVVVGADYEGTVYTQDHGEGLYRRSMYTFWKRTCPPPGLNAFDAPEREVCVVRRARTNTPLQALVLLNDPTYLEAARVLAERMLAGGDTPQARLELGFRLATARVPAEAELSVLLAAYQRRLADFQLHPEKAEALLAVGETVSGGQWDRCELAAWTAVASMILNLDETITKG